MQTQKSFILKPADHRPRWHLVNAENQIVGRLATKIADLLRGKGNPRYTPHTDSGDFVVVVNAQKALFTGNKLNDKKYHRHSGHVGGLKFRTAKEWFQKRPEHVIMHSVKGMLPKNSLGRKQLTKLKVFPGPTHGHEAQKPVEAK